MRNLLVKEIMTKKVIYVNIHDNLLSVAELLYKTNIGSVLVKKSDQPEGIVTRLCRVQPAVDTATEVVGAVRRGLE